MKLDLSDIEREVVRLRSKGYSFSTVADMLDKNNYQQVQEIYYRALKKLRTWNYLDKKDPYLIRAADRHEFSFNRLMRLCTFLRNRNLLYTYFQVPTNYLTNLKYLNSSDLEVLIDSRKYRYEFGWMAGDANISAT